MTPEKEQALIEEFNANTARVAGNAPEFADVISVEDLDDYSAEIAEGEAAAKSPDRIFTLTTGSGTVVRFKRVAINGKIHKIIVDELRNVRFFEPLPGIEAFTPELADLIIANDPDALAVAEAAGLEPVVTWKRRWVPGREAPTSNPDAKALPPMETATKELAQRSYAVTRGGLRQLAITVVCSPSDSRRREVLLTALKLQEQNGGRKPTVEECVLLDGIELPTETV